MAEKVGRFIDRALSDRSLGIAANLCFCWAVITPVVAGALTLIGAIESWSDPTGQTIGLIALGPFMVGVVLLVAIAPFVGLFELLRPTPDDQEDKHG